MKNTLKPLPSFVAEENTEDDIAWLHRQLEGEDDALTRAYRLGYQDGKTSKANSLTKPHNVAELAMHARELERELADLKAIHKTAIIDCQQYTSESWKEICDIQEPAAIWLNGKQMTDLMKDKERLDWLIDNNCEIYEPDTALLYCDCDRESIDEMMAQATR